MRGYRNYKPRPAPVYFMNIDGQSGNGLLGAVFGLFQNGRQIASAVSGDDGMVRFDRMCPGNYLLMETEAPPGYYGEKRNFSVRIEPCGRVWIGGRPLGGFRICNMPELPVSCAFHFLVYDPLSGVRLDGAVFALEDKHGGVKEAVSARGGHVTFVEIMKGTYVLRELQAPEGYEQITVTWQVEVGENGYVTVGGNPAEQFSVGSRRRSYELSIHKTGASSKLPLADSILELSQNGKPVRIGTTDIWGNLLFSGLFGGIYRLKELQQPPGYARDPVICQIEITDAGIVIVDGTIVETLELVNMPQLFDAGFRITDRMGHVLTGGIFTLSKEGEATATAVSDANGRVQFGCLLPGSYVLEEDMPPEGYLPAPKTYTVVAEENGTVLIDGMPSEEFRIEHEKPGQLVINETDGDGNPLAGAVYLITNQNGIVSAITTDDKGTAIYSRLEKGNYELKESVPPPGYGLLVQSCQIDVGEDGRVTVDKTGTSRVVIVNEPARYRIAFSKTEEGNSHPLEGAEFELTGQQGDYAAVSDELGQVEFEAVPVGSYTLKERTAPPGYFPDTGVYLVTVGIDGSVTIDAAGQARFESKSRPYPDICVHIQNERRKGLEGAVLELRQEKEILRTVISDRDGTARLLRVAPGLYTISEVQASLGYEEDCREHTAEIGENGSVLIDDSVCTEPYIWISCPSLYSILLYKIDGTNGAALQGAGYQLLSDSGYQERVLSDEEGRVFFGNLNPGYYVLQEVSALPGYQVDEAYYRVVVDHHGTVTVAGRPTGTVSLKNYRLIEIHGRKLWHDYDNIRGMRPAYVTIQLYRDSVLVDSIDHPADVEAFVFTGQPRMNASGEACRYTIAEPGTGPGYRAETDQSSYTINNIYEELTVTIQAVEMRTGAVFDSSQVLIPLGGTYIAYANKYAGYTLYSRSPAELTDIRTNQTVSFYYTYDGKNNGYIIS